MNAIISMGMMSKENQCSSSPTAMYATSISAQWAIEACSRLHFSMSKKHIPPKAIMLNIAPSRV